MRNKLIFSLLFTCTIILTGCRETSHAVKPPPLLTEGPWRATLETTHGDLAFTMAVSRIDSQYQIIIVNAEEQIVINDLVVTNDSVFIQMPVFNTRIKAAHSGDTMHGFWYNPYKGTDYKMVFEAVAGSSGRYNPSQRPVQNISGRWKVTFDPKDDPYPAIGLFNQAGSKLRGTFRTETGDYRYLEGIVDGNKLLLSTFDGSHAFLFTGIIDKQTIFGHFYSGHHYETTWMAEKSEHFKLTDPDSMTYLKEGYSTLDFQFPDLDSNLVSPFDSSFAGKVRIIQIMGTWCPNCMDETRFLVEFLKSHRTDSVAVIGLAFESTPDFSNAKAGILKMTHDLSVTYPVLFAGAARNDNTREKLPALSDILSYPTLIIMDKKGKVRFIHTGFNGPATGDAFLHFKEQFNSRIGMLLKES